ncbi:MAG: RsmE family RNA methyltransferase [bacterium]
MAQIEVYRALPEHIDIDTHRAQLVNQEANHLIRVRRSRPGEQLIVIDGLGSAWKARLLSGDHKEATLELGEHFDSWHEPPVRVKLGLCVLKSDHFETAVDLCVQAGVREISPLISRYTVAKWPDYRAARCGRIALAAAKQCGRGFLPPLRNAQPYDRWCIQEEANDLKLLLDVDGDSFPCPPVGQNIVIAIGPEGGFADEEIETFQQHGFLRVRLGSRRLRSETAAVLAVAQAVTANE